MIPARAVAGDVSQADLARSAKVGAQRACHGIQCDQACVERGFEDPAMARLPGAPCAVEPRDRAAVDQAIAVVQCLIDQSVKSPPLRTCLTVEGENTIER